MHIKSLMEMERDQYKYLFYQFLFLTLGYATGYYNTFLKMSFLACISVIFFIISIVVMGRYFIKTRDYRNEIKSNFEYIEDTKSED